MTLKQDSKKIPFVRYRGAHNIAIFYSRILIAVVISFISMSGYLEAEERNIFTVSDVHVDVTSSSSADARTEAIANGQSQAFQILLQRLVRSDSLSRLPQLSAAEIDQYVQDFTVNNERNSPIRYLADLTFRFKAPKIRVLLRDLEVDFAQTVRKPMLILPIYEVAAANPWWAAWAGLNPRVGLVPFMFPIGDLKDVGIIGAEQAAVGDKPRIKEIRDRYKVDTVFVVHARLISGPKGQAAVNVKILSYVSDRRGKPEEKNFYSIDNENKDVMLKRSADAIRNSIDVAIVERIDLVLISRNEAFINIYYLGEDQQLTVALAQADMKLVQEEGSWTLNLNRISGGRNNNKKN